MVGFVATLRDSDTAIGYYFGFDREIAGATSAPLYLSLLHATIGDAIVWRCTRFSLGRTALEPKAGLGAQARTHGGVATAPGSRAHLDDSRCPRISPPLGSARKNSFQSYLCR